jgi:hypothetical protein
VRYRSRLAARRRPGQFRTLKDLKNVFIRRFSDFEAAAMRDSEGVYAFEPIHDIGAGSAERKFE